MADGRDDLAALAEGVAHVGVHDEVDVTLAVANLAVGQAVELVGQGAHRLRKDRELGRRDGELTAAGADHGAGGLDDVARVDHAEDTPVVLAEHVDAAEDLDLAGAVLEHEEAHLALTALCADAARDGHDVLGVRAVREVRVALLELGGMGVHVRFDGVRVDTLVDELLAARTTLGALVVDGRRGGLGLLGLLCHVLIPLYRRKS